MIKKSRCACKVAQSPLAFNQPKSPLSHSAQPLSCLSLRKSISFSFLLHRLQPAHAAGGRPLPMGPMGEGRCEKIARASLLASHRPSKSLPHEARREPRPPDLRRSNEDNRTASVIGRISSALV